MFRYKPGDLDEDGSEIAVCLECDGTDNSVEPEFDEDGEETGRMEPCPVCCGFGRLDW